MNDKLGMMNRELSAAVLVSDCFLSGLLFLDDASLASHTFTA